MILQYHKEIRVKNTKECIEEHSETNPHKEAFVFISTDAGRQSLTWSTLYERSCAAARSFIQLGVKRNEIVAINLRFYVTFGVMIAGSIPVSVSFTYTDGSDLVALMQKLQHCSLLIMNPGLDNVNWNIVQKLLDEHSGNGAVHSPKLPYLKYLDELPSDWPVSGLVTGGQPMTKALTESFGKAGKFLCCVYGTSETIFLTQILITEGDSFTE
ncbi:uncharacterized protein LOC128551657 [Mercenaria mercenaria]|uniref:uncharacterized protein LOC128551657 n=1 Tax=Mercenaria mercenaria TaxID=6596 RepID=UPI00234EA57D|nr:uncharacterized protein LOC128551657 [Mercenaria mercenaria]